MTQQPEDDAERDATGATAALSSLATDEYDAEVTFKGELTRPDAELTNVTDAETMPPDAEQESVEKPEEATEKRAQFGSLSPSEAARLRWAKVKAQRATSELHDEELSGQEVLWVRVPVRTGEIIRKLNADARKGSVPAAKELRAWLSEVASAEENRVSDLDRRTRQRLLDTLLADIEEDKDKVGPPTPATSGTPS